MKVLLQINFDEFMAGCCFQLISQKG